MKLYIMHFSPVSCYFYILGPNPSQHLMLERLQPTSFP